MLLIENIIKDAIEKDASDIHLINGLRPMVRIARSLTELWDYEPMDTATLYEIYDYIFRGNVEKSEEYIKKRRFDTSMIFENIRLRVNASFSDEIPVFTMRIVKDILPPYESLGIPEVVRTMSNLPQGLILVTGKTNSGKTTTLNSLIDNINEKQNKKILTLENPVEYRHKSKKSIIVQKEVGPGKDVQTFSDGVKNALREDCDILVIGEIRDKETMETAIEMVESGHLVIGTLHTKSCAETVDRMINFYEVRDQIAVKNLLSSLLKIVVSQRLLKSQITGELVLVPEVMVVDNTIAATIRKEKFNISEIEDAIQGTSDKGSMGLINSLAKLYVDGKLSLEQIKAQIEEKNYETLNRTIMQLNLRRKK